MPSELKKVHTATFEGGIVTTIAPELRQPNTAEYILNCDILSSGEGNVGIITNQKGNTLIQTPLPDGENKTIGTALDEESKVFYFAVWNSNGYHTWYQYDAVDKQVSIVMQSITDTGGIDILRWDKQFKILHADVVRNNLLYWADGLNPARKINIAKAKDKSSTGYGAIISEDFIDAYKHAPSFSPFPVYDTDTSINFNRHYGNLYKFAYRFIYDDGEKSNYSDFSIVPIPTTEGFTGIDAIPINNNVINISVETGSRIVVRIEIAMLRTNPEGGFYNWKSIALLDKEKLSIPNGSTYVYAFYNDSRYDDTDQKKIIRPYSFMPKKPLCQSFVGNSMVYANGYEGFDTVPIDVTTSVVYNDLFIADDVVNDFNAPIFTSSTGYSDYYGSDNTAFDAYGTPHLQKDTPVRFNVHILTVGHDVKKGNKFSLRITNGSNLDINTTITATISDTAVTIVNSLRNWLLSTGRIYRETEDIGATDIFNNEVDLSGNITFRYIFKSTKKKNYAAPQTSVNPIQFSTLKDNGVSVKNIKMGFPVKLGIEYEDYDGRKSLVYTDDSLITNIATINENYGIKAPVITLNINHKPPLWAKYYQIVRASYYDRFIQFMVQKVLDVASTETTNTLDLIVGSLYTYQKIHPNTTLKYPFAKGDRIRFLYKSDIDTHAKTYYDFFETEVIQYQESTTETVNSNVTTAGTTTVTVALSNVDNIGKYISIDGNQREIIAAPTSTTYTLDNPIGGSVTYLTYDLVDYRSSIRIRKPDPSVITIEDYSVVEVYSPTSANEDGTNFHEFSKKFQINNYGTVNATHGGNIQQQTDVLPAIVDISDGDVYVRNRELPVNNIFPGAQVEIGTVEDPSYSDFYESRINDNGRINKEDTGNGEVHFGSRFRYSNNFIEDTRINGLNDFDNLDREDYNDQYGDVKLIKFDENKLFTFKEGKDCWVPVRNVLTQDNEGTSLLVGSSKLLNPIQYFVWNGGIGNNPESYARNGNQHYHVSANSGVIIRLGGSGVIPISAIYQLDNEVRTYLDDASRNGADIYGGFNRKKDNYLFSIADYQNFIFNAGFDESKWVLFKDPLPDEYTYEILSSPSHGTLALDFNFITYTPDTDYIGSDTYSYRVNVNGTWLDPINDCIDIVEVPEPTAWRAKESSYYCVLDTGVQTGYKGWATLEQYYIFSGTTTGVEKDNLDTDADYNAPVYDSETCVPSPDPFSFIDVTDADLSTLYASNTITISGLVAPVGITITGGQYSINGGTYTSIAGTINSGDTVQVRQTSSSSYSTTTTTTLTVGGYSDDFDVTTEAAISTAISLKFSTDVVDICTNSPILVYIDIGYSDITIGVAIYYNPDLTGPVNIYSFVTALDGTIYAMSSNVVGAPTGSTC